MFTCLNPSRSMTHKQRDSTQSIVSVVVFAYFLITAYAHVHAVRLCLHDSPLTQQYWNTVQEMKLWKLEKCKQQHFRMMLGCKPTLHTARTHTHTHTQAHTQQYSLNLEFLPFKEIRHCPFQCFSAKFSYTHSLAYDSNIRQINTETNHETNKRTNTRTKWSNKQTQTNDPTN